MEIKIGTETQDASSNWSCGSDVDFEGVTTSHQWPLEEAV
jgi:hypothetical protein